MACIISSENQVMKDAKPTRQDKQGMQAKPKFKASQMCIELHLAKSNMA